MKKLIIFAFLLCGYMQAWADTWTDDEGVTWYYSLLRDKATINKSSKTSGDLIIPAKVYAGDKEYNVTQISGFKELTDLTSVTIPEGVTSINSEAFIDCTGLKTVNIPESVKSIAREAFYGCTSLTSIIIPEGVQSIGESAFCLCTSLETAEIPSTITSVGSSAFGGTPFLRNQSGMVYFGKVAAYYIGSMPENTSIEIKDGTVQLSGNIFYNRANLSNIYIPSSVTSIGYEAFYGCTGLTKVVISDLEAWLNISFSYDEGRTYANPLIYAHHLYLGDTEITNLVIPEGTTTINRHAFQGCSGFNSVTFPSTLTTIGDYAFKECSGINNLILPEGLKKIGEWAFSYSPSIESVTIPTTLTSLGYNAFEGSSGIKIVVISDLAAWCKMDFIDRANPMEISKCFYSDEETKVTDLVIPTGVVSIGQAAFHNCSELKSLTLPKGLSYISKNAFFGCSGIENIFSYDPIPPTLDYYAFYNPVGDLYTRATLYVPFGCKDAYKAKGWRFTNIIEMDPEEITLSLGSAGKRTFASAYDLDLSETTGVKAYIASDFNPETGKLLFTQVDEVPAGTGLYLKGNSGEYTIPVKETSKTYSNLLVGLTEDTEVEPVSGDNTNFILANGKYGVSFYTLSKAGTITAGKAYLSLPTSSVENLSKEISFVFEDEEATGISQIPSLSVDDNYYSIDGHVIKGKPTNKGLYIYKGKKFVIK